MIFKIKLLNYFNTSFEIEISKYLKVHTANNFFKALLLKTLTKMKILFQHCTYNTNKILLNFCFRN